MRYLTVFIGHIFEISVYFILRAHVISECYISRTQIATRGWCYRIGKCSSGASPPPIWNEGAWECPNTLKV